MPEPRGPRRKFGDASKASRSTSRPPHKISVVIADDHAIFREGLRRLIAAESDLEVVGEARDGEEALRLVGDLTPDILLLDLSMPRMPGLEVLRRLRPAARDTKVLILAAEADIDQVTTALRHGARGVVLKDTAAALLFKSIRRVMEGHYWVRREIVCDLVEALAATENPGKNLYGLTPRELEVTGLVATGNTNKDIARACGISEDTVKRHLTSAFDKTGVSNRLELALFAGHHGLTAA